MTTFLFLTSLREQLSEQTVFKTSFMMLELQRSGLYANMKLNQWNEIDKNSTISLLSYNYIYSSDFIRNAVLDSKQVWTLKTHGVQSSPLV